MRVLFLFIFFVMLLPGNLQSKGTKSEAKIFKDKKNGYFMFIPPQGWTTKHYRDPRTKVMFSHPRIRGLFIRLIVREAPGENYSRMVSQDKKMARQLKSKGISCEVKENVINGLRCSEIFAKLPNKSITMLRKFISGGLHFNIQYQAPNKTQFNKLRDKAMNSLDTITILKVSTGNKKKARDQQIANRIRLAELLVEQGAVKQAKQVLKEAQKEFPKSTLIQDTLKKLDK